MNTTPGVYSQGFNLPDLFNSAAGGAHHVVTDRYQLDQFKLRGMDPMVSRVVNPSKASFYLANEAEQYPTAWLDLDGNERASVQLRNSDLNRIHILLLQLKRNDLPSPVRQAAVRELEKTINRHRAEWMDMESSLQSEIDALEPAIEARKQLLRKIPKDPRKWPAAETAVGADKTARREMAEAVSWETEKKAYQKYLDHIQALLALKPDTKRPLATNISQLMPALALGDQNTIFDLQKYVAGPGPKGLVLDDKGELDEAQSFRHVDYFRCWSRNAFGTYPSAIFRRGRLILWRSGLRRTVSRHNQTADLRRSSRYGSTPMRNTSCWNWFGMRTSLRKFGSSRLSACRKRATGR